MMAETTEYGLTRKKSFVADFPACDSSEKAARFARQFYGEDMAIYESFFIILLSGNNRVTGWAKISQGGTSCTVVDAKMVAKFAIDALAQGVICVHNHPSGNRQPSIEDIRQTKKIREELRLFDIRLLDHIILTETSHYSMADKGDL